MNNIKENISLKPYNTFGIEATARHFSTFASIDILDELIDAARPVNTGLLVLGGGSNLLFTKNVDGLVLKNEMGGVEVVREEGDAVYVKAGGGENWHQFVLYCIEKGFAGVENLSLIPGSVGASPMQNIGAYGVEIKDVFFELEAYHIKEKKLQKFSLEDCQFGYRDSVFKKKYKGQFIITGVTFKLFKKPHFNISYGALQQELDNMGVKELSINVVSQAVINIRSSKLPDWKILGNAGSFFKNPTIPISDYAILKEQYAAIPSFTINDELVKVPAGWLIEQCGWKGYRKGDAGCYEKQALVLVNFGNASGREVYELSEEIIQSVQNKFAIKLEREVNII